MLAGRKGHDERAIPLACRVAREPGLGDDWLKMGGLYVQVGRGAADEVRASAGTYTGWAGFNSGHGLPPDRFKAVYDNFMTLVRPQTPAQQTQQQAMLKQIFGNDAPNWTVKHSDKYWLKDGNGGYKTELWYLVAPTVGSIITNTTVTYPGLVDSVNELNFYTGVDQSSPFGASASGSNGTGATLALQCTQIPRSGGFRWANASAWRS